MKDQQKIEGCYTNCRGCIWQCKCGLKIRDCNHFYSDSYDNCIQEIYYDNIIEENYKEYMENIEEEQ